MATAARYHLGLPVWANTAWRGRVFTRKARPAEFLGQYARAFDAVEGNTAFHHTPDASTVARWRQRTPETFRFCFKFPRRISHDLRLGGEALAEAAAFVDRVAPLGPRLGSFLLQLPPDFGPGELDALAHFLEEVPPHVPLAVEVRHPRFYGGGDPERDLEALLTRCGVDRAAMDTRALRGQPDDHPDARDARSRKPDLARRAYCTGPRPFVRYVGPRELRWHGDWLETWADTVAGWIAEGRTPHVFIHTPGDTWAPEVARAFHGALSRRVTLPPRPPWPGETEPSQLSLI